MPRSRSVSRKREDNRATPSVLSDQEEALRQYLENCSKYGVNVDPSVCITLQTGWDILRLSKQSSTEGSLLPLMGILDSNTHVRKIDLRNISMSDYRFRCAGNGNSNARALRSILNGNTSIEEVHLGRSGLDDDGLKELCTVLHKSVTIKSLNLSGNDFTENGANSLRDALSGNNVLQEVDLSNNRLGYDIINSLQCACGPNGMKLITDGNFVFEEVLNASSHGFGFLLSIVGSTVLMNAVVEYEGSTDYHYWACLVYSVSLMCLFLFSTLYHSFFMMPQTYKILQILDNIGIYTLIAGSYTPIMLVGMHDSTKARVLLIAEWIMAAVSSCFAVYCDINHPGNQKLKLASFLVMGTACLLIIPDLREFLPPDALWLLIAGGLCYMGGVVFFIKANTVPIYHAVWHIFVLVAAALHWFCIYFYLMNIPINLTENLSSVAGEVVGELQNLAAQGQHFAHDLQTATGLAAILKLGENMGRGWPGEREGQ